jgi:serine/threonine protein kinase
MPTGFVCPGCGAVQEIAPEPGAAVRCPRCQREFPVPEDGSQPCSTIGLEPGAAPPTGLTGAPTIPGYDILDAIGKGGMGQVYKARQRNLDRTVAIKIIRSELLEDQNAVRRFQREAKAVAKLAHPNIVAIFDAAEADGVHYLVMEYLEGEDLGSLVRELGMQPVAQVCDWIRQAALGLAHLHERGLVHRDVKPHNLLASPDRKVVKILDLGLARVEADPLQVTRGTPAGQVLLGTPAYLAPEQSLNPVDADARSDIYSLGCTMYHLLTGRTPFRGSSAAECAEQHRTTEAKPIESLRPKLPAGLPELVRKMMAKRPEDRFQSADQVAAALAAFCTGLTGFTPEGPILPRTPEASEASGSILPSITLRRPALHKLAYLVIGGAILGFAAIGMVAVWFVYAPVRPEIPKNDGKPAPLPFTAPKDYLVTWRSENPDTFTVTQETEIGLRVAVEGKVENNAAAATEVTIKSGDLNFTGPQKDVPDAHQRLIDFLLQRALERKQHPIPPPTGEMPNHWLPIVDSREEVHVIAMPAKPTLLFAAGYNIWTANSPVPNSYKVFKTLAALMPEEQTVNPDQVIRNSRDAAMRSLRGRLEYEKFFKFGPFPAYEGHVAIAYSNGVRGTEFLRYYLVGNHLILNHAQAPGIFPDAEVNDFFRSFKILPKTMIHGGADWQGKSIRWKLACMPTTTLTAAADPNRLNLRLQFDGKERVLQILPTGVAYEGKKHDAGKPWTTVDIEADETQAAVFFDRQRPEEKIKNPFQGFPTITLNADRTFSARVEDGAERVHVIGKFVGAKAIATAITLGQTGKATTHKRADDVPSDRRLGIEYLTLNAELHKSAK